MSVLLADVNVLLALFDKGHVHHRIAAAWFSEEGSKAGWATCAITENGFIRIISGAGYPPDRITPLAAATLLSRLKTAFASTHHFWPCDISLCDAKRFDLEEMTGSKQNTDVYLAGLAMRHKGRIATFDRTMRWQAVRGATEGLVRQLGE